MSDLGFYARKCWYLAFIIVIVAGGFYVNDRLKSDLRNDLASAHKELKLMQVDIDMSAKRVEDYRKALSEISKYSNFIFAEDQPQELIDKLKSDATEYRVVLSDIQFDIPEFIKARDNTETMALMKFQASLIGGYYSLWEFIKTLESRPYLDQISEMNVSSHNPEGSKLKMELKGTFRVFDRNMVKWCVVDGT